MKRAEQVNQKKTKKDSLSFTIKVDPTHVSNIEHVRMCEKFPARTFEDKRFKKPKHKEKYLENY